MSEQEINFEEQMTFGLMNALEAKVIRNTNDKKNCANKGSAGMKCCFAFICYFTCCENHMNKKFLKRQGLENDNLQKYIDLIDQQLGSNKFLHGDEIGILDLSLYGVTNQFAKEPKMECIKEMEDMSPLFKEWLSRMTPIIGKIN